MSTEVVLHDDGVHRNVLLDVFDVEPIPFGHPLLAVPNLTISPHLGYVNAQVFAAFHRGIVEALVAWLDGAPIRVVNAG